jgi:hypothetical protein
MTGADAALDMLSAVHPAFAFAVFVLLAAALSASCELIGAALGYLLEDLVWGGLTANCWRLHECLRNLKALRNEPLRIWRGMHGVSRRQRPIVSSPSLHLGSSRR